MSLLLTILNTTEYLLLSYICEIVFVLRSMVAFIFILPKPKRPNPSEASCCTLHRYQNADKSRGVHATTLTTTHNPQHQSSTLQLGAHSELLNITLLQKRKAW